MSRRIRVVEDSATSRGKPRGGVGIERRRVDHLVGRRRQGGDRLQPRIVGLHVRADSKAEVGPSCARVRRPGSTISDSQIGNARDRAASDRHRRRSLSRHRAEAKRGPRRRAAFGNPRRAVADNEVSIGDRESCDGCQLRIVGLHVCSNGEAEGRALGRGVGVIKNGAASSGQARGGVGVEGRRVDHLVCRRRQPRDGLKRRIIRLHVSADGNAKGRALSRGVGVVKDCSPSRGEPRGGVGVQSRRIDHLIGRRRQPGNRLKSGVVGLYVCADGKTKRGSGSRAAFGDPSRAVADNDVSIGYCESGNGGELRVVGLHVRADGEAEVGPGSGRIRRSSAPVHDSKVGDPGDRTPGDFDARHSEVSGDVYDRGPCSGSVGVHNLGVAVGYSDVASRTLGQDYAFARGVLDDVDVLPVVWRNRHRVRAGRGPDKNQNRVLPVRENPVRGGQRVSCSCERNHPNPVRQSVNNRQVSVGRGAPSAGLFAACNELNAAVRCIRAGHIASLRRDVCPSGGRCWLHLGP